MEPNTNSARNMIFVSHANPEDNLFTRWLALRLAREGYPVWCDLTKLLGGEDFWRDIEAAIRDRTAKFLYVLSKTSNQKQGTLDELALARRVGKSVNDFIIPLRVDDLRSEDITIELQRVAFIDFSKSWVAGYKQLLDALEKGGVARDARFTPDAVTTWWRDHYPANEGVIQTPERCLSNWFEFSRLPTALRLYSVKQSRKFETLVKDNKLTLPVSAYPFGQYLVTFSKIDEFAAAFASNDLDVDNTIELDFQYFREEGLDHPEIDRRTARNILTSLFRQSFERFALSKGLLPYELSGGAIYHWFPKDLVKDDKIFFVNSEGRRAWRAMVGFKSLKAKEGEIRIRNWHFGIHAHARFWPVSGVLLKSHVAFTENGTLYESKAKQHSARRSQCKSWYNDDWIDRICATTSFLAGENSQEILIPLGCDQTLGVRRLPLLFECPVSFQLVEQQPELTEPELDDQDEESEPDDEEAGQ